ncbi:DMT family transporter [Aeromicrobium sp.]|uniref:DMT family transporter n=1 Tax=Aeromicrobium sp. TaxID=1871063 RepID=UPI0019CB5F33|nr:DMT family transporter [Aeromicrobium sp.]MBC7629992.1 DMT family transporter [Aeromicrobium sp.]
MHTRLAAAALLSVTAVWGSTFFLIKDLLDRLPAADFLAVRFALAAVVMLAVAPRAVVRLDPIVRRRSVYAGLVYAVAQILQTIGLGHTDASVSGFITGLYVVATPVLASLAFRQRISRTVWTAVALATVGLGILSLRGLTVGFGEALTFVCAILYAVHIVLLSRWSSARDAYGMATIQMGVIALLCLLVATPGGLSLPQRTDDWLAVVYMALVAGAFAMVAQTWAQGQIDASRAALLMTMEPVFAASFAIVLGGELLGWRVLVGGALVLAAMMLAEVSGRHETRVGQGCSATR